MSRTSRRISRPLIAVLAVVVVLFVVFTVSKVRKAHAQVAVRPISAVTAPDPTIAPHPQPAAPKVVVVAPAIPATAPAASGIPIQTESAALVTQTPTERVSESEPFPPQITAPAAPTSPVPPESTVSQVAPANPSDFNSPSNENDAASLREWAKGAGKSEPTPPGHVDMPLLPVADAKTKLDAGDLISAREILNANLIAGHGDSDALKKQIEEINMTLIFSARKFPSDPWGGSYQVAGGERLGSIAARNNVTWEGLARINGVTPRKLRSGQWIKIIKGPFFAVVTKHAFKMDLYLGAPGGPGSMFVRTFQVGLGKDNSTPTGLWGCKVGDKIRNPRYYPPRGGEVIAADDPKNPLNGYWIALEGLDGQALGKQSYGIHGTIDPDSVGKMASMGCIRLRADDISWVFDLLVDGKSKVLVKE
jgi:hypothetical protein